MNSTFSLKLSIALLVLGLVMVSSPKQPVNSMSILGDYQLAIADPAIGIIANTSDYETI
jgi:hypothetical protein